MKNNIANKNRKTDWYMNFKKEFNKRDYINNIGGKRMIDLLTYCLIDYNYSTIFSEIPKTAKILEVGPGSGFFTDWML